MKEVEQSLVDISDNLLSRCSWCGGEEVEPHSKYSNMCVECGITYHKYHNYRHKTRSNPTVKTDIALLELVDTYKEKAKQGYTVPKSIWKGI